MPNSRYLFKKESGGHLNVPYQTTPYFTYTTEAAEDIRISLYNLTGTIRLESKNSITLGVIPASAEGWISTKDRQASTAEKPESNPGVTKNSEYLFSPK